MSASPAAISANFRADPTWRVSATGSAARQVAVSGSPCRRLPRATRPATGTGRARTGRPAPGRPATTGPSRVAGPAHQTRPKPGAARAAATGRAPDTSAMLTE